MNPTTLPYHLHLPMYIGSLRYISHCDDDDVRFVMDGLHEIAHGSIMADDSIVPGNCSKEGTSDRGNGRGRGRGRHGGRGGRESRGGNSQNKSATGRGHSRTSSSGNGNNNRHPKQPSNSSNNDDRQQNNPQKQSQSQKKNNQSQQQKNNNGGGGRGRVGGGRPRSSSNDQHDYYIAKKSIEGPYSHLFCSERHGFALSRVLFQNQNWQHLLLNNDTTTTLNNGNSRVNSKITSDQLEQWWEAVKIVRCHVPINENMSSDANSLERCPICLDEEMTSPFIAPCGHIYCLPCVLTYLSSVAKDINTESERIHKNKRGGSGIVGRSPVGMVSNRASVTSVRARCPLCSSGSSMEIKAGEAMVTYKDLRPVVFVPVAAVKAASVEEAGGRGGGKGRRNNNQQNKLADKTNNIDNARLGSVMKFVKLHRVKECPAPYLPLRGNHVRGCISGSRNDALTSATCLPDLPDGDDDVEECIYARHYFSGLLEYERILQYDLDELVNYRENNVHCQLDPREDWNVSMAIEAIQAAQRRWMGCEGADGGFRSMEWAAKSEHLQGSGDFIAVDVVQENDAASNDPNDKEQQLLDEAGCNELRNELGGTQSATSTKHGVCKAKKSALLKHGSAYLHQVQNIHSVNVHHDALSSSENIYDEFLSYQSSDGQLCFLSGIDVACLMHEFSLHHSGDNSTDACTDKPLPDSFTGTVIGIEHTVVTHPLIKRKPFLSHVPLNSSVSFVEIDWYSGGDERNGPMLSKKTLSKFRGELQRRKSDRLHAAKVERKADMAAKAKSEKEERRRRLEVLGPAYLEGGGQQIDPDDEFFQIQSTTAEEAKEVPVFRFNRVCAEGGMWPELSTGVGIESGDGVVSNSAHPMPSSPTLHTAPLSSPTLASTWGSRNLTSLSTGKSHKGAAKVASGSSAFPSLAESSRPPQRNAASKPQTKQSDNLFPLHRATGRGWGR